MEITAAVLTGFLADCIFGDPRGMPHPVVLIGNYISLLERLLRRIFPETEKGETAAGWLLALIVPATAFALSWAILKAAAHINPWLGVGVNCFFCYQIFAARSLRDESMRVYRFVEKGDLENSRKYLSRIVGRDTADLDYRGIDKAVVETVAENTSDGVIAPMFYMAIGGAPLAFLYKGVNTLDSMVGYKNERYLFFGRPSARLDDVLNYIPARITGLAICAAGFIAGFDGKEAFRIFRRDRRNHSSPNSAHPESACAGALNIQLGGDAYYFGKLYRKKTIGDPVRTVENEDIRRAVKLMYTASVLCLAVIIAVKCLWLWAMGRSGSGLL